MISCPATKLSPFRGYRPSGGLMLCSKVLANPRPTFSVSRTSKPPEIPASGRATSAFGLKTEACFPSSTLRTAQHQPQQERRRGWKRAAGCERTIEGRGFARASLLARYAGQLTCQANRFSRFLNQVSAGTSSKAIVVLAAATSAGSAMRHKTLIHRGLQRINRREYFAKPAHLRGRRWPRRMRRRRSYKADVATQEALWPGSTPAPRSPSVCRWKTACAGSRGRPASRRRPCAGSPRWR